MKRFRVLTAALCAAVLLCGFSVPAYAYAGGEGEDYGDPTMETPAPEPTITPGEGFSEEGNLVTRDLLYDEHTNKQFITVQTSGGNALIMTSPWTKKANSMKPTFSALWMRGICWPQPRPLAWNRQSAPVRRNVRRELSIPTARYALSIWGNA